jgi:hypothetical protein
MALGLCPNAYTEISNFAGQLYEFKSERKLRCSETRVVGKVTA